MSAFDFSLLDAYYREYRDELFVRGLTALESIEKMTLFPGIKDEMVLTALELQNLIQGWTKDFNPTANAMQFKPRTIKVEMGKVDLEIVPENFRQTWMAAKMRPGINHDDIPFEGFIMQQVFDKIAEELETQAIFGGVKSGGTPTNAGELFDGFGKIIADEITATNLTAVITGAITGSNAYDSIQTMWRSQPAWKKLMPQMIYCSYEVYEFYCDDYLATFGAVPYNNQFEQVYLPGTNRRGMLCPLASWGSSLRS